MTGIIDIVHEHEILVSDELEACRRVIITLRVMSA
jgi:hypothetical protein